MLPEKGVPSAVMGTVRKTYVLPTGHSAANPLHAATDGQNAGCYTDPALHTMPTVPIIYAKLRH